jgi:hypothetical protein
VAWRDDPQTAAALENVSVWPEVVAAGERAVGGGSVDKARLEQIHAQIIQSASRIRLSDAAASDEEMARLASRAMGLASRLALGLSEGSLEQQQVELAAARLNEAIAAYEAEAAVRQAQCG